VSEPQRVIPFDRLPAGFAERIEDPPDEPSEPRPAATVVLLRPGPRGPELLLTRRSRTAGFVPGAYVFPGGTVDGEDAEADLVARIDGVDAGEAATRLGVPPDHDPPPLGFWVAAIREAFEETGILVGRAEDGGFPPAAASDPGVEALRLRVLDDEEVFPDVLDAMGCRMDGGAVEYIAHWITPLPEPRRYDTRFFAAAVPGGSEAIVDPREMTDAVWLTPAEGLRRLEEGSLPMIFPTIKTLESLRGFASPEEILDHFSGRAIPEILPRLVRTEDGVGTVIPNDLS